MSYNYKVIQSQIHLFQFSSQYHAASTFMRLQEFYESPDEKIRGHYFTVEEYMDWYAEKNGNFTYTSDWHGFNIPGHIVDKFASVFPYGNRTEKEKDLINTIGCNRVNGAPYYVLGTSPEEADVLDHELCHALYYLSAVYKACVSGIIFTHLNSKNHKLLFDKLKEDGYDDGVLWDELNAYLSTSSKYYIRKHFNVNNENVWTVREYLKHLFLNEARLWRCTDLLRYKI